MYTLQKYKKRQLFVKIGTVFAPFLTLFTPLKAKKNSKKISEEVK